MTEGCGNEEKKKIPGILMHERVSSRLETNEFLFQRGIVRQRRTHLGEKDFPLEAMLASSKA